MKYILVIGDGMADNPVKALGGLTPLEKANIPTIDRLAAHGELGSVLNVPEGFPRSDTANYVYIWLCTCKVLFRPCSTGGCRTGHCTQTGDAAFRCNNISISDEDCPFEEKRLLPTAADRLRARITEAD
jgi:2,3-bisphosphoglycerate-independent phosphoglycerate mutase